MKLLICSLSIIALWTSNCPAQDVLTKAQMRDIDGLVVRLLDQSRELHAEFHEHLQGVPHGAKLEADATEMERVAKSLHDFALNADGSMQSVSRIRSDTNQFMQFSFRMSRTIGLAESWTRTDDQRRGISHMRSATDDVNRTALQLDALLPLNAFEIDGQAELLEEAIKELHAEYHEHLEGYEVSAHLDQDLEEVERLVEHMHELCHGKSWGQIDLNHLVQDIQEVKQKTSHIESLFVQQSRIGVRTRDWVGIEHSRDAITDVLSTNYLLEHMIAKSNPSSHGHTHGHTTGYTETRRRPKRDR